jgi:hypothetical protein
VQLAAGLDLALALAGLGLLEHDAVEEVAADVELHGEAPGRPAVGGVQR